MPTMTVQKWRALSLKRLAHLSELQRNGRWHLFYSSQAAFDDALREANADADRWKELAYVDGPRIEAAE